MTDEREELKGKLLMLWLEDLKNDKEPGFYPELNSLTASETEEIMSLARFIKGNFYPSEYFAASAGQCAKELSKLILEERTRQIELNKSAILKSATFNELVLYAINSLTVDKTALQVALALPRSTFSDLETGKMPPHRLPHDTMIRLLVALQLVSAEIVESIRKSSMEWAAITFGSSQTQLGRIDTSINSAERCKLMGGNRDLAKELERIESYCQLLLTMIPRITEGSPSPRASNLEDDETSLHH